MGSVKTTVICLSLLVFSGSAWSNEQAALCSNMRGVTMTPGNDEPIFEADGFSGQDYIVAVRDADARVVRMRGSKLAGADIATILRRSSNNGWVAFHSSDNEVARLFTLFTNTAGTFLAMTEHQTDYVTGLPQVRSFFAKCKSL